MDKEIILITTYGCNLRCSYCYEPKTENRELTPEMARQIILGEVNSLDETVYDGVTLQFMGGEPLLKFDLIREISEWIWATDFKVPVKMLSVTTNGTLLNDEMKRWFAENRHRIQLMLSFDGTRMMQNLNRSGSAGAVDLGFFAEVYPESGVKMTLSPATIGHFFEGVVWLYNHGLSYVEANLAYGAYNHWNSSHLATLRAQLDLLVEYYASHPDVTPIGLLTMPVWNILFDDSPQLRCHCGQDVVCYDCDGEQYPCHLFSPVTLPRERAEEARRLDFAKIRADRAAACNKCLLRNMCIICFGANYMDRGDCNAQSAFDCAQFKLFYLASCKLHKLTARRDGDNEREQLVNQTIDLISKCKQSNIK